MLNKCKYCDSLTGNTDMCTQCRAKLLLIRKIKKIIRDIVQYEEEKQQKTHDSQGSSVSAFQKRNTFNGNVLKDTFQEYMNKGSGKNG